MAKETIGINRVECYRPEHLPIEDQFLKGLANILGVYVPKAAFDSASNKEEVVKYHITKQAKYHAKQSSDYSWVTNPDRMGQ